MCKTLTVSPFGCMTFTLWAWLVKSNYYVLCQPPWAILGWLQQDSTRKSLMMPRLFTRLQVSSYRVKLTRILLDSCHRWAPFDRSSQTYKNAWSGWKKKTSALKTWWTPWKHRKQRWPGYTKAVFVKFAKLRSRIARNCERILTRNWKMRRHPPRTVPKLYVH